MDYSHTPRKKKSDKAKEKHDRNGGISTKHVRVATKNASNTSNASNGSK